MKMGDPVVGWIEPGLTRRAAISLMRSAALMALAAMAILGLLVSEGAPIWPSLVVAGVLMLYSGYVGWFAWFFWRMLNKGWGVLQARHDGDEMILGTPLSMFVGKGKRFSSGETVTLSVSCRTLKRQPVSAWTVAGSGGTVVATSVGVWTGAQWYELCEGLQRLGFTVVTDPEAAGAHASALGR